MKHILFLLIILVSNVCYGQVEIHSDNIIILVTDQDQDQSARLSRIAERYFNNDQIRNFIKQKNYQYVQYHGQKIDPKFLKKWNVQYYPTIVHIRKVNGNWYRYKVFNPRKLKFNLQNVLSFLGKQQPQSNPGDICLPGGS